MRKMKCSFPTFVLIAATLFVLCGCFSRENSAAATSSAESSTKNTQDGQTERQQATFDTDDWTAILKEASYQNFKGKTEEDFVTKNDSEEAVSIDFGKIFELARLNYEISKSGEDIIITPMKPYNQEEDFRLTIHLSEYGIVTGSTLETKRDGDIWGDSYDHHSATDCIFGMSLGLGDYLIGVDELDYLWYTIRTMTAPLDKVEEVTLEIEAEFRSYYEPPYPVD